VNKIKDSQWVLAGLPKVIYLGFKPSTIAYSFFIPKKTTTMSSNQAQLDETASFLKEEDGPAISV
jgi:hypothetical protein